MTERAGPLFVIGGHEDKEGDRAILSAIAERLAGGKLVIATVASHQPEGYFDAYRDVFTPLGVTNLVELYVEERSEALDGSHHDTLAGAAGIFFSGGDQLRIVNQIGDTPIEAMVRDLHRRGGLVAGTSAGASVMSDTMLVGGNSDASFRIGELRMASGLGLIENVVIDQHFAERGRIGRLLGAIAHNPRQLGIGIDEDTAILVEGEAFRVIGSGGVTVVDAAKSTRSNIAEAKPDQVLSMLDVTLHALSAGDGFDLASRRPLSSA